MVHPSQASSCELSHHGVLMAQQFLCVMLMRNHVTVSSAHFNSDGLLCERSLLNEGLN